MFSTLNRYIYKSISSGLLLSVSMFSTLLVLLGFIQQINVVGRGDFTVGSAVFYTLLTLPSIIVDFFPVSSVVGVMIGLGALAANSELVVMQSSGYSRLKIAKITIVALIIWLIPISLMGEYVVPPLKLMGESYKSTKISKDVGLGLNSGVWIRDGNVIFNATPVGNSYDSKNNNIVMNDVTVYELDESLQVIKVSKAKKATHLIDSWELENIEVTEFVTEGVKTQIFEKQIWPSRIKPEILSITHARPKYLSMRDIIKYKKFQASKENIPAKYDVHLWSKIFYPLIVIATAVTGLPFLFGLLRSGGFGQRLLIGVTLGIILYYVNRIFLNMGEVYHINPIIITGLPSAIILFSVLWLLKIQKQ